MRIKFLFIKSYIREAEVTGVVNGALETVLKHDPELLRVKPFYLLLLEKCNQLEPATDPKIAHPLSPVIKLSRKRRDELVKSVCLQAKSVEKGKLGAQSEAAFLIVPVIKKFLVNLDRLNEKVRQKRVRNFLSALAENESMGAAATTIGIGMHVEELKLELDQLSENTVTRREDNSKRRMVDKKQLISETFDALTNLLKAIELAKVQYPETDYMPLISELNEMFAQYRTLSRSRKTRSINEAIKKETVAMSPTTTATAS